MPTNDGNDGLERLLKLMPELRGCVIEVRRQPDAWSGADVTLSQIDGLHLGYVSGGVGIPFPHPTLCAYVSCDGVDADMLNHSCSHGPPPHDIKVCIPKVANKTGERPRILRVLRMIVDGELNLEVAERIIRTGRKNGRLPHESARPHRRHEPAAA